MADSHETSFPYPVVPVDLARLLELHRQVRASHCTYGLGAKVAPLSLEPGQFHAVDCSGYTRWLIWHASSGRVTFVDGSAQQHEQAEHAGFKRSSVEAGKMRDGALRIAFLSPEDGGGVGHVALLLNGSTIESHGHHGPDSREWTGEGWQAKTAVYVLTAPRA